MPFQSLDQQIAHLKDQHQELKARTGLETNYLKKQMQVQYNDHIVSFYVTILGISKREGTIRLTGCLKDNNNVIDALVPYHHPRGPTL